jgi:dethiobiotin synthetase
LPVVLVSRSTLGTINHTLLSLEAIRRRGLPLAGVVINGPETPHNRAAIERYGQVEVIAEIPWLDAVTPSILMAVEPELDLAKLAKALP